MKGVKIKLWNGGWKMINPFLKNLNKIEFVVTNACTGRCIHCSQGEHTDCTEHIDAQIAAESVKKICSLYDIKTVMTFGGEPLLFCDTVEKIMKTAAELNIPKRQVITNGYFSNNPQTMQNVAKRLLECGVNDLLLSVDAFHQSSIPLNTVKLFAFELKRCEVPVKLQPAWLVSPLDDNVYNRKTREILDSFWDLDIQEGEGNVVFPCGNALKYLSEFFTDTTVKNPYTEDPSDVRCVSFSPNGDVLYANVYERDIVTILDEYKPNIKT